MTRSLLSLLFLLAGAAGASAQTAPKPTTPAKTTVRKPVSKAQLATSPQTTATSTMADAPTSTKSQTQNIYAAPGEPIQVPEGKVGAYDGPAAGRRTTKGGTTLTPR